MINFNSNIRLTANDNNRYQTVYASQSYGTFYAVFAKFTVLDILDNEGQVVPKKKLLEKINLKLINYKGLLNISLEKGSEKDPNAYERRTDSKSLLIKIKVKGAADGELNTEDEILFNEPVVIEDGMFVSIIRELLTLSGKTNEEFMDDSENTPFVGGVFDDEFYERDGVLTKKKKEIGFDLTEDTEDIPGSDFETVINLNWPGKICRKGDSRINIY
jgi:hypothetical protein